MLLYFLKKKHFVFCREHCNDSDIKEQARTLLGFFASATTVVYETAAAHHVSVHQGTLAWDEKVGIPRAQHSSLWPQCPENTCNTKQIGG